jgi:hypothetical protein
VIIHAIADRQAAVSKECEMFLPNSDPILVHYCCIRGAAFFLISPQKGNTADEPECDASVQAVPRGQLPEAEEEEQQWQDEAAQRNQQPQRSQQPQRYCTGNPGKCDPHAVHYDSIT